MPSDSELDDELLQVAGQASRNKGSAAAKRKRSRLVASDSDEDVSLDEESDFEQETFGAR